MRALPALAAAAVLAAVGTAADAARTARPPARPTFVSYAAPANVGSDAGEPTLGYHVQTGTVLFQAGLRTLRVTGFDGRGGARWEDVSPLIPSLFTFDPILETDRRTGRTWTSQLDLYCSRMAYTDDVGETWTQVPMGCGAGAAFDHQMVGVGPYRSNNRVAPTPGQYPNVVYYCAQTVATAQCSTSLDGGFTFLPARPAYDTRQCSTIHGHLKSAKDGTAYLPANACSPDGEAAFTEQDSVAGIAVTEDNAATWRTSTVPGSTVGDALHPSLDVGEDGTVYFGWGGGSQSGPGGPPFAAVSRDKGRTWSRPAQLGKEYRIANTRFVTTTAGDGDRAAVAFLGSPTPGDASAPAYRGEWHLYVAFTYDRGRTWQTVDATPKAPVQVGGVCTDGTTCANNRNLLDFIDSVIDGRGKLMVAIADGCPGDVCTTATRSARATLLRQSGGRGLLKRYDPK